MGFGRQSGFMGDMNRSAWPGGYRTQAPYQTPSLFTEYLEETIRAMGCLKVTA